MPDRLRLLDTAVKHTRGEWTTRRVMSLYRSAGWTPKRATCRHDLRLLERRGLLVRHETPGRRYWTPTRRKAQP